MVAVVPRTCGTILWEAEHTGVEREAAHRNVNIRWNGPSREDDVPGQIEVMTRALDQGARGLILSPVEALPLRAPVYTALQRGIPVVVVGTDIGLAPDKKLAYVLNDEQYGGQLAARYLGKILNGKGTVALVGANNQLSSTAERARSVEATLNREFPGIQIVYRSLALPTTYQEQQVAEKLLVRTSHLDAIVALNETSTRGAFYALTEFGRVPDVHLIGFDQDLLVPLHSGGMDAVVFQNTYQMGRVAMKLLDEELHGGSAQKYAVVQPTLVTRESLNSPEAQQMLDLSWFSK